jgi:hypothetical protein
LTSSTGSASVPSTVTIPAGKTSTTFTATTKTVTGQTIAKITATLATSSKSANLTIKT